MPKSYGELPPGIERRLSAWISLLDHRRVTEPQRPHPTITISRRFGCDAFTLSERLKALLDAATGETWTVFDRALLERVSHDEHLSMDLLSNLGAGSHAVDAISVFVAPHVTHNDAFRLLARHLVLVAEAGNAIIVGRGGAVLTQRLPNCYHFRLDASEKYCIEATMRRLNISQREAAEMLQEYDTTREGFIEHCLRASVTDIAHYHAIFNRERSGIDEIARSIVSLVAHSWVDKTYFRAGSAPAVA
jgi:hypothetical protein